MNFKRKETRLWRIPLFNSTLQLFILVGFPWTKVRKIRDTDLTPYVADFAVCKICYILNYNLFSLSSKSSHIHDSHILLVEIIFTRKNLTRVVQLIG